MFDEARHGREIPIWKQAKRQQSSDNCRAASFVVALSDPASRSAGIFHPVTSVTIFVEHGEKNHAQYASTLKTCAILVSTLAGILLGSVPVSASTESVQVVRAIPSAEDCKTLGNPDDMLVTQWGRYIGKYEDRVSLKNGYTLDEFKADMNSFLTSPEIINCQQYNESTVAHYAASYASIETAKWAVSKGIDLAITDKSGRTAYDVVLHLIKEVTEDKDGKFSPDPERLARWNKLTTILKGPAPATKSCAEVDGQTPPANEYCIIAENMQSSRRIAITGTEKRFVGRSDYRYEAHRDLSGTGLFSGWRAVITFTCSSRAKSDCGHADYVLPSDWTPEQVALLKPAFEVRYGLNVHCGESADLLDLDRDLVPGESISVSHASDTERSFPWHMDCRASALDPFTLTVKTTRLAQ